MVFTLSSNVIAHCRASPAVISRMISIPRYVTTDWRPRCSTVAVSGIGAPFCCASLATLTPGETCAVSEDNPNGVTAPSYTDGGVKQRHRNQALMASYGPGPWCGSNAGYQTHRCRCAPCTNAHRIAQNQANTRRHNNIPDDIHGLSSTYTNYSCRCDDCKEAHSR